MMNNDVFPEEELSFDEIDSFDEAIEAAFEMEGTEQSDTAPRRRTNSKTRKNSQKKKTKQAPIDDAARRKMDEEQAELVRIMDGYRTGDPELVSIAQDYMVDKLKNFIWYIITTSYSTYGKYHQDLFQEGVIGILSSMSKYDPLKGRPTTFFNVYIIHEMSHFIDVMVNHTTSHYSNNISKIAKVIDMYEQIGVAWTPEDIAIETGLTPETIAQSLKIRTSSNEVHYTTTDYLDSDDAGYTERYGSPEDNYMEQEKNETIRSALKSLTEEESLITCYRLGLLGYDASSFKSISEKLHIPIDKVRKLYYQSIKKMRTNPRMKRIFHDFFEEEEGRYIKSHDIPLVPEKQATETMDTLQALFESELSEFGYDCMMPEIEAEEVMPEDNTESDSM